MKERPIIFNAEMVRAILADRKTQSRRVIKPQPILGQPWKHGWIVDPEVMDIPLAYCPYGIRGDRLWVRETWAVLTLDSPFMSCGVAYRADGEFAPAVVVHPKRVSQSYGWGKATWLLDRRRWRPSIHMPRWASRINLEIVNVRAEPIQNITLVDAIAEGFPSIPHDSDMPLLDRVFEPFEWFHALWDSLNQKRGFGWDANPWCWVPEFKRVK